VCLRGVCCVNSYDEGIILYVMEVFNGSAVMGTVSIGALHQTLLRLSMVVGWGNSLNCNTTLKSVWETEGTNILAT
jgi:hypothetical protein